MPKLFSTPNNLSYLMLIGLVGLFLSVITVAQSNDGNDDEATYETATSDHHNSSLGALRIWDDGLAEMSYYRAIDTIYGKPRPYTRVVLVNRQWMHPQTGIKTDLITSDSVPVFKLNMVEEIPTENYNYRYQTTMFLERHHLKPFKMVASSQEWCGTTFKHLRWSDGELTVKNFSYIPNEGDTTSTINTDAVPYESLLLIARDVVASGQSRTLNVLNPMRSRHGIEPQVTPATLTIGDRSHVTTPIGTMCTVRVNVQWSGQPTSFVVESMPPYRLIRYRTGGNKGTLEQIERRAYWDRKWPSRFHKINQAP